MIYIVTFVVLFIFAFRAAFILDHYSELRHKMTSYGTYKYDELCYHLRKQIATSRTLEEYSDYVGMMNDLDDSSKKIVDSIQHDFIECDFKFIIKHFFRNFNAEQIYKANAAALKFIPDELPTDWQRIKMKELSGFYAGVIALQIGRVSEMESIILASFERK